MQITSLVVVGISSYPSGNIELRDDDTKLEIKLTADECAELIALAWKIYDERKSKVAENVVKSSPTLLANFSENSDDIPF